jgi:hypothetical protein
VCSSRKASKQLLTARNNIKQLATKQQQQQQQQQIQQLQRPVL